MAVQDKGEVTSSITLVTGGDHMYLDTGTQSLTAVQLKEMYSSGDELAPKVRKPYTITKQRERWTEEEHKKFLEALKLYGRAWRRIEEHVSTKTAVQIRSHAQKFFSKVVRESSSSDTISVKPIEIPPPRPKRKPMHPYPRKMVHSNKKRILVPEQPERSSSPIFSVSEQENQSPTSVLSVLGSDTMGSTLSNLPNDSPSPVSSAGGRKLVTFETAELAKEDNGSLSTVLATSSSSLMDQSSMKFDLGAKDNASIEEAPIRSLKLFGKTVMVTDSHRPSSSPVGTPKSSAFENYQENVDSKEGKPVQTLPHNPMQNDFVLESNKAAWSPWPCRHSSALYYMQFDNLNPVGGVPASSLPWWPLYGSLPFAFLPPHNQDSVQKPSDSCLEEASEERENQNGEESWTGSNNTSMSKVEKAEKNGDIVESQNKEQADKKLSPAFPLKPSVTSAFCHLQANPDKCSKGFVPYKRCLAEREAQSSGIVGEEREGQRIQLCL